MTTFFFGASLQSGVSVCAGMIVSIGAVSQMMSMTMYSDDVLPFIAMSLGSNVLMIGTWLMALNFSNPLPFVTLAINLWKTYILLWSGATAYTIYSDSAYNDGILCVNGRCVSSLFIVNYKAPQVKNNQKTRLDSRTPPLVETTTKSNVGTTRKFSTKRQIELIVPSQGHYTIRIRSTTKKPFIPKITTKKLTTITPRGYNTSIQTTPPKIRPTPNFTSMATVIRSKTTIISVNSFTTPNLSLKPNITTQLIFNTSTNVIPEYIQKNSTNSGLSTEATLQTSTEIQTITAITPKTETFITMTTLKPTTKSITTLEPLTKVTTTIMTSTINPITITPHKKSTPLPPKTTIKKTTNTKKTTKSITSSHKTKNKTTLISTSATTLKPIITTPHKISTFLPSKTTQIKTTFGIKETPPIIPTFKPYDPTDPCDCNITIPEVSSTHHTETTEVYDPDCDCGITNKKLNLQYQSTKHSMRFSTNCNELTHKFSMKNKINKNTSAHVFIQQFSQISSSTMPIICPIVLLVIFLVGLWTLKKYKKFLRTKCCGCIHRCNCGYFWEE